jgi:hypothetical protein
VNNINKSNINSLLERFSIYWFVHSELLQQAAAAVAAACSIKPSPHRRCWQAAREARKRSER